MKTCETPFVIWFTGRTGSTFLCDLLDSHPEIRCLKEQFCEVKLTEGIDFPEDPRTFTDETGTFGRRLFCDDDVPLDNPTDEQTLNYLAKVMNSDHKACGFKLKFPSQSLTYPEIVDALRQIKGLKVIELIRVNVLKQVISYQNMLRINKLGISKACNAIENVQLEPIEVNVPKTIGMARHLLRSREEFGQFTQMFDSVLPVRYEELLTDQEKTLQRITDFLGVDSEIKLQSDFKKATPDKISQAVSNYDDLAKIARRWKLDQFLD